MRFRNAFVVMGGLFAILLLFLSDPDLGIVQNMAVGAGTVATLIFLFKAILGIGLLHLARKALMDYPEADFRKLGIEALKDPKASAMYAIAIAIYSLAIALMAFAMIAYG